MNFEIGDRCIVTRSEVGNEGKICEVTGFMTSNDFNGVSWQPGYTMIVTSLGSPFTTNQDIVYMSVPMNESMLRKLPTILEPELEMETY